MMDVSPNPTDPLSTRSIRVGLTCWRWEAKRSQAIIRLAQKLGVTVTVSQRIHGLRREIEAHVSGPNIDRFIGEFVRHC